MNKVRLGIIGGSGIYDIEGVEDSKWEKVSTPFGDPSDKISVSYTHLTLPTILLV